MNSNTPKHPHIVNTHAETNTPHTEHRRNKGACFAHEYAFTGTHGKDADSSKEESVVCLVSDTTKSAPP